VLPECKAWVVHQGGAVTDRALAPVLGEIGAY